MYACVYECMYVCMYIYMYIYVYICMYVCLYVCMHTCMWYATFESFSRKSFLLNIYEISMKYLSPSPLFTLSPFFCVCKVVYITSVQAVRQVYDDCQSVLKASLPLNIACSMIHIVRPCISSYRIIFRFSSSSASKFKWKISPWIKGFVQEGQKYFIFFAPTHSICFPTHFLSRPLPPTPFSSTWHLYSLSLSWQSACRVARFLRSLSALFILAWVI